MIIDVNAPCSLPLGLVRLETAAGITLGLLGLTLKYPPVQLTIQPRAEDLSVTGARAPLAHDSARRLIQHQQAALPPNIEVEWAIASQMGLGSEPMLGLSVAEALARLHQLPVAGDGLALARALGLGPEYALSVWGFQHGGLLLVEAAPSNGAFPSALRRRAIAHTDKDAWAFIFLLPQVPDEVPSTFEAERWRALMDAAGHVSPDTGRVLETELWPALERDDLSAFSNALRAIQRLTYEALAQAGTPVSISPEAQSVIDMLNANGSLLSGQSLAGLAVFGLVGGQEASHDLRARLRKHVGSFAGTTLASIADNTGVRYTIKEPSP